MAKIQERTESIFRVIELLNSVYYLYSLKGDNTTRKILILYAYVYQYILKQLNNNIYTK